ncbi:MAG: MATE family efflux transporter [Lachnospiraceae bacterium]
MNQDVFEKYPIPKAVFTMALPTVLSMLVTVFYNMADTFFVGQTGDANQVAAVSLTTPVFLLAMAVGNIFGIGGSSFISRLLGEGLKEKAKKVSAFCCYASIAFGIIMMFFFLGGMNVILKMIGADSSTYAFAQDYLTYIGYGAVFIVFSNAFGNIIRSEGAAKQAMIGMMIGTIVNIVLDPIMILGMNMGVSGAAIATVIGNICATIYYLFYFLKGKTILSIAPKDFSINREIMIGVFSIGIPASLNNVLMSVSNIVLNIYLVSYGTLAVAGMGVAMKVNILVILVCLGVGMGVQPLVGYNYGSGNHHRMKQIIKFGILCNVCIGTLVSIVYCLFTKPIISAFIKDPAVIDYGITMLRVLMISAPFIGIMFIFNFSFQAMGKALPSLLLSIGRQGLFFFPILILSNKFFGLEGVIFAQPLSDIASVFISLGMFLIIRKQLYELSQKGGC